MPSGITVYRNSTTSTIESTDTTKIDTVWRLFAYARDLWTEAEDTTLSAQEKLDRIAGELRDHMVRIARNKQLDIDYQDNVPVVGGNINFD